MRIVKAYKYTSTT